MDVTELLTATENGIAAAANLIGDGRLVAFPTETVYGLGADATNDSAVARVFEAKGRPSFNPLIIHVATLEDAEMIAEFNSEAERLASAFWPGPLTLVLPLARDARISRLATAGGETVALRIPASPVAQDLLQAARRPIAAPSANPSGRISPTSAAHVLSGLGGRIDAIVDGGPANVGLESTVVAPGAPTLLLRHGGVPLSDIERVLGASVLLAEDNEGPASPGRDLAHYAPKAALRMNADAPGPGEVMLGFGSTPGDRNLSEAGDLVEAAANLFALLHALDALGKPIAVAPIPETGLGQAINDRLRRAAGSR